MPGYLLVTVLSVYGILLVLRWVPPPGRSTGMGLGVTYIVASYAWLVGIYAVNVGAFDQYATR
jgi:hypothetical protein